MTQPQERDRQEHRKTGWAGSLCKSNWVSVELTSGHLSSPRPHLNLTDLFELKWLQEENFYKHLNTEVETKGKRLKAKAAIRGTTYCTLNCFYTLFKTLRQEYTFHRVTALTHEKSKKNKHAFSFKLEVKEVFQLCLNPPTWNSEILFLVVARYCLNCGDEQ